MKTIPILLDSRPHYLHQSEPCASILMMPIGGRTVVIDFSYRLRKLTASEVLVVPDFPPNTAHEAALREASPHVREVVPWPHLRARVAELEPSDWLMMVDARYMPAEGLDLASVMEARTEVPRAVRHMVVLETHAAGTKELLEFDEAGRVKRIQRYYDAVTWPFTSGILCSLVPVSSFLIAYERAAGVITSLKQLRSVLAMEGVPSRDVPVHGEVFDLADDHDFLMLNQRSVLRMASARLSNGRPFFLGDRSNVHSTVRLVGPVVIHDGASVERDVTIVGPTVVGAGALVERGATVAQCVVVPGTTLPSGLVTRNRIISGATLQAPGSMLLSASKDLFGRDARPHDVEIQRPDGAREWYPAAKAIVDRLVALATLVIGSPLFVLIAVLVKLDSKGSVLYSQKREGKNGKIFPCYKFRTMTEDADARQRELLALNEVDGPQFKLKDDPRLTRLGRWLRLFSFDELPQFINVLLGHMSLVGPRPSPFRENQICVPWRDGRLSVKPGITGLWQVCRHDRANGDFHQWIYYDLLYVAHMSPWIDFKIVLATIITGGGKGHVPLTWIIPQRRLLSVA